MKLEVGMYARYNGGIGKIKYICDYDYCKAKGIGKIIKIDGDNICVHFKNQLSIYTENNVVASHNIIDLIEVGDYVNGKLVEDIFDKTNYADKSIKLKGSGDYWHNEHIKSIVTKEQFVQMEYKID